MRVAAAQAASVWLDPTATTNKIVALLEQASRESVELVAFPESFLSGYPFWVMLGGGGRFGDPEQGMVGAHRKLTPTHAERLVWGRGDGHGLRTHRLGPLRVGGLNCWENWMPLARDALYADGEELHVAAWPGSAAQTRDIARFVALEGRVYVVLASGLLSADTVPKDFPFYQLIKDKPEGFYNGGSCIVAPDGSWVVEPKSGKEGLIVADIYPARVAAARHSFDPTGHYARPDVFDVT